MNRKMIGTIATVLLIGLAVFFYLDTVFLPLQFKRYVILKAQEYLQRPVAIEHIDINPLKGFVIKNMSVGQRENPGKPFVHIPRITFNILLVPLFQKKTLIIPNIKIRDPYIMVTRQKDNNWNFSDLLNTGGPSKGRSLPIILFRKLSIEKGNIVFTDHSQEKQFQELINNINLGATLSLNKGVRFVAEAHIPKHHSSAKIKGSYGILSREMTAQILLDNIHLAEYLPLYYETPPYTALNHGVISGADFSLHYKNKELQMQGNFIASGTDVRIGPYKQITGTVNVSDMLLTWRGRQWDAKGRVQIPSAKMIAASGKEFFGDIDASLNLLTISDENITSQGDVLIKNAHLKIAENRFLKGDIDARNASLSHLNDTIRLKGNITMNDTLISIDDSRSIQGNFSTTDTNLTWTAPDETHNRTLQAQSGFKGDSVQIMSGGNSLVDGTISASKVNITYYRKKLAVESQGQMHETTVHIDADKHFQGSPHFNIVYTHDGERSDPADYTGTLNFSNDALAGIPRVESINRIEGILTVRPDTLETEKLTFITQDTELHVSGVLTDFKKPFLDIKSSSENITLERIIAVFPEIKEQLKTDLSGAVSVNGSYTGPLRSPSDADIEFQARLAGVVVSPQGLPDDITNISAGIHYENDLVQWDELTADYKGTTYALTGQLANFSKPVINTTIASEHMDFDTQIKLLNQAFQITKLKGHYLGSRFDLRGDAHLFEDASPDIDLRGDFRLSLEDLGDLIPRLRSKVRRVKPSGVLAGEGVFQGKIEDWRNWKFTFDATAEHVRIRDYVLQNISIRYAQRDQSISKFQVNADVYNGTLTVTTTADLRDETAPFTSSIHLENMDLSEIRKGVKTKNDKLAGIVFMTADLNAPLTNWRDLKGEGRLDITNGYLWQWNILDGISSVLLIPEFKSMAFTTARADFSIYDERIHTSNAHMESTTASLDGKGWIDFNQNLNFNIVPTFSEIAILKSKSAKKKSTSILTQTDGYINIKLTGTLSNPKHSVEKFPMKIIEETIGGTTGTLKEVIGGIVDEIF